MFSNRFNTKNDPLVGAVEGALKEGAIRRQAEAIVNEHFGVYSRKAVVREELAAYDAALEEVFSDLKEGKGDGNLANNYPPYDKVTRGDVIAGRLGKDQMGGKKKAMKEESADHLGSSTVTKSAPKEDPSTPKVPYSQLPKTGNRAGAVIDSAKGALKEDEQLDEVSKGTLSRYIKKAHYRGGMADFKHGQISGRELATQKRISAGDREASKEYAKTVSKREKGIDTAVDKLTGKARVAANEETQLDELKRSTLTSYIQKAAKSKATPENISKRGKGMETAAKKIQRMEEEQIDELKQSTVRSYIDKAHARASDAKSAGFKKDFSEKKGKKAASARAEFHKRVKGLTQAGKRLDELSAFGAAFKAAGGKNFTFGGKQYSGARADAKTSGPQNNPGLGGAIRSGQFATRDTTPIATRSPAQQQAKVDASAVRANKSAMPNPTMGTPNARGGVTQSAVGPKGEVTPGSSADYAQRNGMTSTPSSRTPVGVGSGSQAVKDINKNPSAVASVNAGNKAAPSAMDTVKSGLASAGAAIDKATGGMAGAAYDKARSAVGLKEEVQVGANKYRIV